MSFRLSSLLCGLFLLLAASGDPGNVTEDEFEYDGRSNPNQTQPLIEREYLYGEAHLDAPAVLIDAATGNVYTYLCDQNGTIYALANSLGANGCTTRSRRHIFCSSRGGRRSLWI